MFKRYSKQIIVICTGITAASVLVTALCATIVLDRIERNNEVLKQSQIEMQANEVSV